MDLTRDEHTVRVGDVRVTVTGASGPISATWRLLLDDREVARQEMLDGEHVLAGALPDGTVVEALVYQSIVGPTRVRVRHEGVEILATSGFVA
jgi:hypothetical protein